MCWKAYVWMPQPQTRPPVACSRFLFHGIAVWYRHFPLLSMPAGSQSILGVVTTGAGGKDVERHRGSIDKRHLFGEQQSAPTSTTTSPSHCSMGHPVNNMTPISLSPKSPSNRSPSLRKAQGGDASADSSSNGTSKLFFAFIAAMVLLIVGVVLSAKWCTDEPPLPVRVVVVTMFWPERQQWLSRGLYDHPGQRPHKDFDQQLGFDYGSGDVRYNSRAEVLLVTTGVGTTAAATCITALGLDKRFDFTKAYWLVTGVAGVDPADASVGSAMWASWVVDGDLCRAIDPRDMPPSWTHSIFPLGAWQDLRQPYPPEVDARISRRVAFPMNSSLADWAYRLTKDMRLADTQALREVRANYTQPKARRPPFVLKGAVLTGQMYWAGSQMTAWANDWVRYYTRGAGEFVMTAMEDSGIAHALSRLGQRRLVEPSRLLVLRTASDYCTPPPGRTAAEVMMDPSSSVHGLPGLDTAAGSAWHLGRRVVLELSSNWDVYGYHTPQ